MAEWLNSQGGDVGVRNRQGRAQLDGGLWMCLRLRVTAL